MFGDQSDGDAQQETSARSESHAAADDQTVIVAATWGAANDQVDAQQETRPARRVMPLRMTRRSSWRRPGEQRMTR